MTACIASAGQSTMPWNPDANDDSYVGASDMLSTLAVYGQQIGIDSSLTCDYDGSSLEEWLGDLWSGIVVLDSVRVQYHVEDSSLVYVPGCPDPVWDSYSYERSWIASSEMWYFANSIQFTASLLGYQRVVRFEWSASAGSYKVRIWDHEITESSLADVMVSHAQPVDVNGNDQLFIPIPGDFTDSGLEFEYYNGFLTNATYVNILPYWHYAE